MVVTYAPAWPGWFGQWSWLAARLIVITSTCETTCAHPAQATRYGDLKHRLAGLLETGRPAYSDGKAQMITEFPRQARLPLRYLR